MHPVRLPPTDWAAREVAHLARVEELVAGHEARRRGAVEHPVEDFLFVYYSNPPGKLRRWHPGPGIVLEDAGRMPRASWRHYVTDSCGGVALDVDHFAAERGSTVAFVRSLLAATVGRAPHTGCFGLHEWAMVYRSQEVRHTAYRLRLSPAETDEVVDVHQIRCTHYDAFRFFTPAASPRNALQPNRDSQVQLEQPGCLHAGMDVYKWCFKLAPLVPGELTLDAFDLARGLRTLDMRASPYDLRDLGYEPIPIETAAGKAAYVSAQRAFAERSNALRLRLLDVLDTIARPAVR